MFGIGIGEFVVIATVMLIAVGPRRLPTLMKAAGRAVREFRRATNDLRKSIGIDDLLADDDLRPVLRPEPRAMPAARPTKTSPDVHASDLRYPEEPGVVAGDPAEGLAVSDLGPAAPAEEPAAPAGEPSAPAASSAHASVADPVNRPPAPFRPSSRPPPPPSSRPVSRPPPPLSQPPDASSADASRPSDPPDEATSHWGRALPPHEDDRTMEVELPADDARAHRADADPVSDDDAIESRPTPPPLKRPSKPPGSRS